MANKFHIINGNLIPEEKLMIPVRDLGFLRGYGVFDFLITYKGAKPFHLEDHTDRLFNSARLIGIPLSVLPGTIREWVFKALEANKDGSEKQIRMTITRGVSETSFFPSGDPNIVIMVDPALNYPDSFYTEGVAAITAQHRRYLPEVKHLGYLDAVMRLAPLRSKGIVEAIYHYEGQVLEATTSNLFALIDGRLLTPKSNILKGVTRKVILESLSSSIEIFEEDFSYDALLAAHELFISSSSREVMPVVRLNSEPVGNGKVGLITKKVMSLFKDYTLSEQW